MFTPKDPEIPKDPTDFKSLLDVWNRPVAHNDVEYLLNRMPFLQIANFGTPLPDPEQNPEFIKAPSGWMIHHYGNAMSSSPGELLLWGGDFRISAILKEWQEGGHKGQGGKGTVVKQAVDTVQEMVRLAKKFGWGGILIYDGHWLMRWAAWFHAAEAGILTQGYIPDPKEEQKYARLRRSQTEDQLITLDRPKNR